MKQKRRMISVFLIMMMLFTLAGPVYAADPTYTITVSNPKAGHTYEAYQIFSGDLSDKILSNIAWGTGLSEAGKSALKAKYGTTTAAQTAKAIVSEGDAKDMAQALAGSGMLGSHTDSNAGEDYTISGLKAGYYLIKDQNDSLTGKDDAYTRFMVKVVKDITISPKSSLPTIEKKVQDVNDSKGTIGADTPWLDSADHDYNDKVPFKLTATLGETLGDYKAYKLVFHDTLSQGLTFQPKSVKVVLKHQGSETVLSTDDYSVATAAATEEDTGKYKNGMKITVTVNDIIAKGAKKGDQVVVTYNATLNEHAVMGSAGNPNKVYLEYSNNPNTVMKPAPGQPTGGDTGKTKEDMVIVFTYGLTVNKTDGSRPLSGADFTLYKKVGDHYVEVTSKVKEDTAFHWNRIDDGDYKLVETVTPAGYNSIDDILFTVSAVHDSLSDNPTLTELKAGDLGTGELSTGMMTVEVKNESGATLPETGGMGTTVFYLAGGTLILVAAVLLLARRRTH